MVKKLFCFGIGFSAVEILKQARESGYLVSGCVRSADKAKVLREKYDFDVVVLDSLTPDFFKDITHIVMSIPPLCDGGDNYSNYKGFVDNAVNLKWFGYLSTTGVYGDMGGGFVDELSPVNPSGERGQRRVDSENYWTSVCNKTHIFRLPAIYGTGRSAIDTVRSGTARAIDKAGQVFSRIHIYDIAQTLLASMEAPRRGAVYNVVDDMATSPIIPLHYACDLLGIEKCPVVKYEDAELHPMSKSFYADNKRVKNALIKQELGVKLLYPTYKEGLSAIYKEQKG